MTAYRTGPCQVWSDSRFIAMGRRMPHGLLARLERAMWTAQSLPGRRAHTGSDHEECSLIMHVSESAALAGRT
jgi:hypothetical protein